MNKFIVVLTLLICSCNVPTFQNSITYNTDTEYIKNLPKEYTSIAIDGNKLYVVEAYDIVRRQYVLTTDYCTNPIPILQLIFFILITFIVGILIGKLLKK